MTVLAYQPLPPEVISPILRLAAQLISLTGYFALGAILVVSIRAWWRYENGAGFADLWIEILIILFCAAVAVQTFNIADWAAD